MTKAGLLGCFLVHDGYVDTGIRDSRGNERCWERLHSASGTRRQITAYPLIRRGKKS